MKSSMRTVAVLVALIAVFLPAPARAGDPTYLIGDNSGLPYAAGSEAEFLKALDARCGTTAPAWRSEWTISFSGDDFYASNQHYVSDGHTVTVEGVTIKVFMNETSGDTTNAAAFRIPGHDANWLFQIVSAYHSAVAAGLSAKSTDLVLAFAGRITNPGGDGPVKAAYVDPAVSAFIQRIKDKSMDNLDGDDGAAQAASFRSLVAAMPVNAGHWMLTWKNDGPDDVAGRAADLLDQAKNAGSGNTNPVTLLGNQ